jgi:tetratricopeptide (TPR) repeat protein
LPAGSSPISAALGHIASDLEAGRFLEAESKSRALVKSQPNNVLAWTYLGMASVRLGQAQQGIQAYERAIALNPKDTRLYFDVALLYASKNDLGMAIDRYQKGLSLEDRNGTAYYNYGRLLTSQGRFPEAIAALNRAVEINPIDTEARTALVEVLLLAKQRREAADQVRVFLETSRVPARALVSLGALLGRSGEAELAKTVLTRALSISPDSSEAHVELSKVCLALNQYPSAVRAAKRAVELNPASLETNLALAETFISGRRDPEAVELLSKVQSRFEHSAAFQYTLGVAEYRAGRHQPAIAALKKAVQLDPGLDLAHFLLGQISLTAGELEQAEASFKAAVSLRPKSVLYCNYLARVYEQQGSQFHQAAVELTKRALALDPKDVDSKERLAKWAKEEGDLPRARALLEQVVAEAPGQISARVLLASVYYRLNLRKEGDEQQKVIRSLEAEAQKQPRPAN